MLLTSAESIVSAQLKAEYSPQFFTLLPYRNTPIEVKSTTERTFEIRDVIPNKVFLPREKYKLICENKLLI